MFPNINLKDKQVSRTGLVSGDFKSFKSYQCDLQSHLSLNTMN